MHRASLKGRGFFMTMGCYFAPAQERLGKAGFCLTEQRFEAREISGNAKDVIVRPDDRG